MFTYLTPTTSGYGINASHIPATWSFMMMAKPRIRAAEMIAVARLLRLISSHSFTCVSWKKVNTPPAITSSVNTMPPSEWAKKPQASPARSPYKMFPDEAARAIPMKIATVNSFSE